MSAVPSLPEHNVALLVTQLGLILLCARAGGALMSRLGQPAVLGEILAGIALGPSLLGALAPALSGLLFPAQALSYHLLEGVSWIGMVLLVFLVGLEVDLAVFRRVGRPALKVMGATMAACLAVGVALGRSLPDHLAGPAGTPVVFAAFMALAAAVVAVPILAKILLDLGLLQRDMSLTAVGAALAADLVLWTGLSLVLDMARLGRLNPLALGKAAGGCALFLAAALGPGRPVVRWLFRAVDERLEVPHRRVTLAAIIAFTLAAATHGVGVHAVFGAFIAGIIVGAAPRFKAEDREVVDAVTNGILAPVFFSYAGLLVDLRTLAEWGLVAALAVGWTAAKLAGGYVGARLGGFPRGEAFAIGVSLNAGGAMGIVLALLGLSAGIVGLELYSALVAAAVVTTLATPALLRLLAPLIPPGAEERARLEKAAREARSVFRKGDLKALLPSAGGPSTAGLITLLAPLAAAKKAELSVFMVREPGKSLRENILRVLGWDPLTMDYQAAADAIKRRAQELEVPLAPRIVTRPDRAQAVLQELERGYALLALGTHTPEDPLGGDFLAEVAAESPCHVALYRPGLSAPAGRFTRILLPSKGDPLFPFVLEFAALYADSVPGSSITVLHAQAGRRGAWNPLARLLIEPERAPEPAMGTLVSDALQDHAAAVGDGHFQVEQKTVSGERAADAILAEASRGKYDLILLGGVKSLVRERLFFGSTIQELLRRAPCPVVVLSPARGGLGLLAR